MLPDAAAQHYREQQRVVVATLALARRAWQGMSDDFDASWREVGPRLEVVVMSGQLRAAQDSARYVPVVLDELGLPDDPAAAVRPAAFAGVAGDGRRLDTLLLGAMVRAKEAVGMGARPREALTVGGRWLDMAAHTAVADAGRAAESVALAARPGVGGWVRMVNLPACSRCVVLAGRWYRWSSGFARHPQCDCRMIPASESIADDLTTNPRRAVEAGQVRGLSEADRRAIVEDGADVGRVVNARRGMFTAADGRKLTRERGTRPRPEQLYRDADGNRARAIDLLREHGYLT